ncbi:MAG: PorP/SprF family type IX secretion system membrane protein [Bacteroidota bacterium]
MKTRSIYIVAVVIMLTTTNAKAQDVHFTQYNNVPLMLNPAGTGSFSGDIRASTTYRNQWSTVAKPYSTYAVSFESAFLKKKWKSGYLAGGLQFFNDRAGDAKLGTMQYNFSLSCVKVVANHASLSGGLMGGYATRKISGSDFTWDSQYNGMAYDPGLSTNESTMLKSTSYADMGAGILYTTSKGEMYSTANNSVHTHLGASVYHLNQPDFSLSTNHDKVNMKFILHGGGLFGIKNTTISLVPDFMFALQGPSKEFLLSTHVRFNLQSASHYTGFIKGNSFYVGGVVRTGDAIALSTMLEKDKYFVGFSYDFNVSKLSRASSGLGGFEITLRFVNFTSDESSAKFNNVKFY